MGARKIYIIDHGSTVPVWDVVEDYVHAGIVDYSYVMVRGAHAPATSVTPVTAVIG
jgi:hypothetical protein